MPPLLPASLRAAAARTLHTQPVPPPATASNALSLIRSQPSQYIIASVAGRKYLLTPRDLLTVPRLNDVKVGDVLKLSDHHSLEYDKLFVGVRELQAWLRGR